MKVIIKNESGEYLTLHQGQPAFDPRKSRAIVYDLERDRVEEQIASVRKFHSALWSWEEVGETSVVDDLPSSPN